MYSDNDDILLLISKFLKRVNPPFTKKELTVPVTYTINDLAYFFPEEEFL